MTSQKMVKQLNVTFYIIINNNMEEFDYFFELHTELWPCTCHRKSTKLLDTNQDFIEVYHQAWDEKLRIRPSIIMWYHLSKSKIKNDKDKTN